MSAFRYSGKPSHPVIVTGNKWAPLDVITGPFTGSATDLVELHMLYANATAEWEPNVGGLRHGAIEFKYVRDDGDDTGYQTIACLDGPGRDIIYCQPTHWELADPSGRPGRWHVRISGHISKLTITTRYAKAARVRLGR